MKSKEYKVFKTAAKTARENNLVLADGWCGNKTKTLFDFSLLDATNLSDTEKRALTEDAIKHVSISCKSQFYGKSDAFWSFNGTADYKGCPVYSQDGKRLYNILVLKRLERVVGKRQSVYEEMAYTSECYKDNCYTPDEITLQ